MAATEVSHLDNDDTMMMAKCHSLIFYLGFVCFSSGGRVLLLSFNALMYLSRVHHPPSR